jgi:hypothetical protein
MSAGRPSFVGVAGDLSARTRRYDRDQRATSTRVSRPEPAQAQAKAVRVRATQRRVVCRGEGYLAQVPPTPPGGDVLVVHGPANVRLRVALDAVPGLRRLEQCGLHEVLREVVVAGEEVRRVRECRAPGDDEGVERCWAADATPAPPLDHHYAAGPQLGGLTSAVTLEEKHPEMGQGPTGEGGLVGP